MRLAPPMTISSDELVEGVGILASVLAEGSASDDGTTESGGHS